MKSIIPGKYKQYEWIAKKFSKIKNVELVVMNTNEYGLNLFVTNNRTGKSKKVFTFPLRGLFFVDYTTAADCPHPYDIMALEEPEHIVGIGVGKAKLLFDPR